MALCMRARCVSVLVAMAGCGGSKSPPASPASPMTQKMRRVKADVESAQKAEAQRDDRLIEQAK